MIIDRLLGVMWIDTGNQRFYWKTPPDYYEWGGPKIVREWQRFTSNFTHKPRWTFLQTGAGGEFVPADQVDWWTEAMKETHGNQHD